MQSPARAFMKPASTRSILKRPAPLPLSPNPLPFAASFSVVVNSSHLSPHVHFPSSPTMAATFTAYSANTYDRGAIKVSPASATFSSSLWANRPLSPSAHNAFKLLDPPKRKSLAAPAHAMIQSLTVPVFEDPRSPKPYKDRAGISFDELTIHVPRGSRGAEELGKALSTYPRSPYPSAPIEEDMNGTNVAENRGRWPSRTLKTEKSQTPHRAHSLENKASAKRRQNIGSHMGPPLKQNPVTQSPRVTITKPAPLELEEDLNQAFWQSVSLEEPESAYMTANEMPQSLKSPGPELMFGNKDGSLWSPRLPKKDIRRGLGSAMGMSMPMSPAQRRAFSKGMVASPSPNDPFAAFPSFSVAIMSGMDGMIAYPPRARVEQE